MQLSDKDSFVIFRHPFEKKIQLLKGLWSTQKPNITNIKISFVLSDFNSKNICFLTGEKILFNQPITVTTNKNYNEVVLDKKKYLKIAQMFISSCKNENIEKIILSRIIERKNKLHDIYPIFKQLCIDYDHSFNYLLNHPEYGMWLGASPEILIKGDNENYYETIALAGSQKWETDLFWNEKEIQEQQFVKKYIENILTHFSKEVKCVSDQETVKAGGVAHLSSIFHFKMKSSIMNLVHKLHPTPAVCGIPKNKAKEIINTHEPHKRNLYCGYLGEFKADSAALYVNLRCMKITNSSFYLYAGGGLTALSIPEKEWEETEIKSQTLLSVIKNL